MEEPNCWYWRETYAQYWRYNSEGHVTLWAIENWSSRCDMRGRKEATWYCEDQWWYIEVEDEGETKRRENNEGKETIEAIIWWRLNDRELLYVYEANMTKLYICLSMKEMRSNREMKYMTWRENEMKRRQRNDILSNIYTDRNVAQRIYQNSMKKICNVVLYNQCSRNDNKDERGGKEMIWWSVNEMKEKPVKEMWAIDWNQYWWPWEENAY